MNFAQTVSRAILIGSLLLLMPAVGTAGIIQFSDGILSLNTYSVATFNNLAPTDAVVLSQKLTGGNPGSFVAIEGTLHAAPVTRYSLRHW